MSLQVWLPLNGTFENHGLLGPLTQTTAPAYVNGKLGKALSTGGCKMSASQTASVLNNKAVSICFWVYINAATGTKNAVMFFGTDTMSTANNRKFSLFNYPTINDLHWSWQNDVANNVFTNGVLSGVFPSYQWTHVAVTYENPNGTIYINGIKKQSFTGVSSSSTFAYETQVLYNSTNTYKNDFRIYDHCLSAREVKEISKGLFLHYKLGGVDGYLGGRNLLLKSAWESYYTSNSFTVNNKTYNTYADGWGGYNGGISNPTINYHAYLDVSTRHYVFDETNGSRNWKGFGLEKGGTLNISQKDTSYIFSATVKATGSGTKLFGGFYYYKTGTTSQNFYSGQFSINNISNGVKSFVSAKVPLNNDVDWSKKFSLYIYGYSFSANSKLEMWHPKLEEGTKATTWTPAPEDNAALYDTTLYDTSGYLGTATPSGTIGYSSDSPRYDGSYVFSDTSHFKLTQPLVSPSQFTCSFWVKPTSLGSYAIITSNYNNPSSGFWIAVNCENSGLWFYNGSYARSNKGLLTLNTWYHACLVFKDGVFTWYQNGEAAGTTDLSSRSKTLGIADTISIGNSFTGTQWNTKFNGNISDFRMYSTALSAADVKELYNTPITITNTGVLMTQGEFKEV